jgi:hypothetical protein
MKSGCAVLKKATLIAAVASSGVASLRAEVPSATRGEVLLQNQFVPSNTTYGRAEWMSFGAMDTSFSVWRAVYN